MPQPAFPPAAEPALWRFLLRLGGAGLLLAGGGLGLLFALTPYTTVAALGQQVYHEDGFARLALRLTPARYLALQLGLAGAAALGLGLLLALRYRASPTTTLRLGHELRAVARRLRGRWQRQPGATQAAVGMVLLALLAVRGWYALAYPLGTDEVASYDYFAAAGPVASTSYYPIPNNHILYNLLAGPLAALGLSPRWAIRLPTLLLGTAGTVAGLGLLARLVGWRGAALTTGLVGLLPMQAYYAAVGRGYFLQFCLLQLAFFSAVELLQPVSRYRRLGWLGYCGGSAAGFYLIPTFAYPFAGLALGLGMGFAGQRRWARVGELVLAGLLLAAVVAVLYAPVGTVSGWDRLLANRYVHSLPPAQFWPAFRAVLYERAANLFGPGPRFSGPLWLGLALLGGALSRYLLPPGPRRTAALLAWGLLALPLPLMVAQRVYAPARVLLYLPYFAALLAVLWLGAWPRWRRVPGLGRWLLVLLAVGGPSGWLLYQNQPNLRALRQENQRMEAAYHWLARQPHRPGQPVRILLQAPLHELFFAHYNHLAPLPPLMLRADRAATVRARPTGYLVLTRQSPAWQQVQRGGWPMVYQDGWIRIYSFAPGL